MVSTITLPVSSISVTLALALLASGCSLGTDDPPKYEETIKGVAMLVYNGAEERKRAVVAEQLEVALGAPATGDNIDYVKTSTMIEA